MKGNFTADRMQVLTPKYTHCNNKIKPHHIRAYSKCLINLNWNVVSLGVFYFVGKKILINIFFTRKRSLKL